MTLFFCYKKSLTASTVLAEFEVLK